MELKTEDGKATNGTNNLQWLRFLVYASSASSNNQKTFILEIYCIYGKMMENVITNVVFQRVFHIAYG